jgi:L-arabinose isomerase
LARYVNDVSASEADRLVEEYEDLYDIAPEGRRDGRIRDAIRYQARLEAGMKTFLQEGGYTAFTTI